MLPFAERAQAYDSKFLGYCLNNQHPYGKHKARVFQSALGITNANWFILRDAILSAALTNSATHQSRNSYGEIYVIDFLMSHETKSAMMRTSWIIHDSENFPQLTSCYVL